MATKVAINGFGRIGRLVARAILERTDHDLELVSINDLADAKSNALLFQRDSRPRPLPRHGDVDGNDLISQRQAHPRHQRARSGQAAAQGQRASTSCSNAPASSQSRRSGQPHLDAGAKRVLISAPATGVDLTVVFGVNHDKLTADDVIVSNASLHHQLPRAGRQGAARRRSASSAAS